MIRFRNWKCINYTDYTAQLFDLEADSGEKRDLIDDPDSTEIIREAGNRLHANCDPVATTKQAFSDQRELIEKYGGPEEIIAGWSINHAPAPGEKAGNYRTTCSASNIFLFRSVCCDRSQQGHGATLRIAVMPSISSPTNQVSSRS